MGCPSRALTVTPVKEEAASGDVGELGELLLQAGTARANVRRAREDTSRNRWNILTV
jgi:hypothetical protein